MTMDASRQNELLDIESEFLNLREAIDYMHYCQDEYGMDDTKFKNAAQKVIDLNLGRQK